MFQFPGFAHLAVYHAFSMVGCPIRTSTDQFLFADPRSFSQLITSFFASESLGIPHTPFLTSIAVPFAGHPTFWARPCGPPCYYALVSLLTNMSMNFCLDLNLNICEVCKAPE